MASRGGHGGGGAASSRGLGFGGKAKGAAGCRLQLDGDLSHGRVRHGAVSSCRTYAAGDLLWWRPGGGGGGGGGEEEFDVLGIEVWGVGASAAALAARDAARNHKVHEQHESGR